MVWNEVLEAGKEFGAVPCGLGARNTLRLEGKSAALRARNFRYDQCVGSRARPLLQDGEAGVHRPGGAGKSKAAGLKRTLVGLEMVERGIARDGYKVLDEGGREIGYVTSGSPAPFLKKNIALAYVPPEFAEVGSTVKVEIRGQGVKAQVVPTPFYKRPKKNLTTGDTEEAQRNTQLES